MLIYHLLGAPTTPGNQGGEQHYTWATQLRMLSPPLLQGGSSPAQCCRSDTLLLLTHSCLGLYVSMIQIWSTGKIPHICQNLGGGTLVWAGDALHTWRMSDSPFLMKIEKNRGMCSSLQISFKRAHLVFWLLSFLDNIQRELLYTCKCYQVLLVIWTNIGAELKSLPRLYLALTQARGLKTM